MTTVSPTVQTVSTVIRLVSMSTSLTVTRAVTVSPALTGARNLSDWLR